MRRSTTITLTVLAGAGLGLAYCGGDPDTEGVLETQTACVDRLGTDAASECADVFASARVTHAATAPRFSTQEACRDATGTDCTTLAAQPSGSEAAASSIFIPTMAGVMIGRALSDGTRGATPVYAGVAPPACSTTPGAPGCPPASSRSGGSGGGGAHYWYSGTSYAGSSDGSARGGFSRVAASTQSEGLLARSSRTGSSASRGGMSTSRSGGLGFSAAAHGGGGS